MVEPSPEQLKKALTRDRQKELFVQLSKEADDCSASYKWPHSKLFAEKPEGVRLIWEYVNMMLFDLGSEGFLQNYKEEYEGYMRIKEFYSKTTHFHCQKNQLFTFLECF